jgi:C-terminal processing protease CtpA/Prc
MLPTHRRCARWNVDLGLLPKLVPAWRQHNPVVASGGLADGIVYLCLRAWPPNAPQQLRPAFRLVRRAAAQRLPLIIDVRANGGGAEPLAARFAGRFMNRTVCYAKHLRCQHGRLVGPVTRWLKPSAVRWRFQGRVAVLVGPGTVSSCESFAMMMRQVPGCKLIGERTAGASGNPKPVALGNGVVLFVPTWQDLELDGTCLEGRGLQPDIEVDAGRGLAAGRDPVLAAAVKLLLRQSERR